jgi:hypothetical protein
LIPEGPLNPFVTRVVFPLLSPFKQPGPCDRVQNCGLALRSIRGCIGCGNNDKYGSNLMEVNEVPDLFAFLLSNGYKIDATLTTMMNSGSVSYKTNEKEIICFFSYLGKKIDI